MKKKSFKTQQAVLQISVFVICGLALYFGIPMLIPLPKKYTAKVKTSKDGVNNPGNIRNSSVKFNGEDTPDGNQFKTFVSLAYGYRAIMVLLNSYYKNGFTTLNEMISRYAPSSENDTKAYIEYVSSKSGVDANQNMSSVLSDKNKLIEVVKYMSIHEQGNKFGYYPDELSQAFDLI